VAEGADSSEFAELLSELKDRSGLSYGVLAKRLHMSTSTLHRYCNGDAVPADYAPVERLARLCKASPEELVELHRRWVLADAVRGRKASPRTGAAGEAASPEEDPVVTESPSGEPPGSRRRTRTALIAAVAVAAVLGAVALAVNLRSGGTGDDDRRRTVGAAAPGDSEGVSESPTSASPTEGDKGEDKAKGKGGQAQVSPSVSAPTGTPTAGSPAAAAPPLTVAAAPYTWESPCSQRYLIDEPPGEVAPPPLEQDAPAWVDVAGAVSSGEQYLTLTVQGTGRDTVVVESLDVRIDGRRSPLAWNDYAMGYPGVGCGGNVPTRSFTVALDAKRPLVVPEAGHDDFPFKVSESDPEVFYVRADASAYDVSWHLELTWSSGARRETLRIDDEGRSFRTSGNNGRPAYEFPLGGSGWVKAGTAQGAS
jgi:transcriptional regulator with XRE-family HTH domain